MFAAVGLCGISVFAANTCWVAKEDPNASDANVGTEAAPFRTIQAALDNPNFVAGDTINVTMRFDPQGKTGEFRETGIVVYGNNKYVQLTLTGECLTNEEMLMRVFPIRVGDNLRLDTDRFDLGELRVGETPLFCYSSKGR